MAETAEQLKLEGNKLYQSAQYEEALDRYVKASAMQPENVTFLSNKAAAELMLGRLDEAVRDCTTALEIEPNNIKVLSRLAKAQLQQARFADAKQSLSKAQTILASLDGDNKTNQQSLLDQNSAEMAQVDLAESEYKAAFAAEQVDAASASLIMKHVDAALSSMPNEIALRRRKLECLVKMGHFVQADLFSRDLIRDRPDDPHSNLYRCHACAANGDFTSAVQCAAKCVQLEPGNSKYTHILQVVRQFEAIKKEANTHFSAGRFSDAYSAYTQAISNEASFPQYYLTVFLSNRTATLQKMGRHEEAIEDCDRVIAMNPRFLKAYTRKAFSESTLSQFEPAIQTLLAAQRLEPKNPEIAQLLHQAEIALKRSKGEQIADWGMVHHPRSEDEYNSLVSQAQDHLVVVDYSASWCGPCKTIAPVFEKLAKDHRDVMLIKVDVDELQELAAKQSFQGVPTFQFLKKGALLDQFSGADSNRLSSSIQKFK